VALESASSVFSQRQAIFGSILIQAKTFLNWLIGALGMDLEIPTPLITTSAEPHEIHIPHTTSGHWFGCRCRRINGIRAKHAMGRSHCFGGEGRFRSVGNRKCNRLAVRMTRDLSDHVSLELGGLLAKPEQQFAPSTLFAPETQLRYRWNAGRLSAYVGGGISAALVASSFHSDWDPTLSVAGGTGVRLTDRLGVTESSGCAATSGVSPAPHRNSPSVSSGV
jgi:hypothetical protein